MDPDPGGPKNVDPVDPDPNPVTIPGPKHCFKMVLLDRPCLVTDHSSMYLSFQIFILNFLLKNSMLNRFIKFFNYDNEDTKVKAPDCLRNFFFRIRFHRPGLRTRIQVSKPKLNIIIIT